MISFIQSIILSCSVMASTGLDSLALNAQALLKIGNQYVDRWQQDFALVTQRLGEKKNKNRKSHKRCSTGDSTSKSCRKSAHHHKKSKKHHRRSRSSNPSKSQPRRLRRAPCPYIDRRRCR